MNDPTGQGIDHPDVGAHWFEYAYREPTGLHRYGFKIHAGDNPDFPFAIRLLPGAQLIGCVAAGFEADTGAMPPAPAWPHWRCYVAVGKSRFWTTIPAPSIDDARARCRAVGGLRVAGDGLDGFGQLTRLQRAALLARYAWERRPTVRRRTPVDCFLI